MFIEIGIYHYLVLSGCVFSIGVLTVLLRKNALVVLMGIELMLNATNIAFVALSYYHQSYSGVVMAFFVMTVAAAEAAVGLAILVGAYKKFGSIEMKIFEKLQG